MNKLKQLQNAHQDARLEVRRLEDIREDFIRGETAKIRQQADLTWGEQIRLAKEAEAESRRAQQMESIRIASGSPLVGCMVEKKKYGRSYGMHQNQKGVERGVVEVMTHETEVAENLRHSRPSIGGLFVRILKADGSPSKRVDDYNQNRWTLVKVHE